MIEALTPPQIEPKVAPNFHQFIQTEIVLRRGEVSDSALLDLLIVSVEKYLLAQAVNPIKEREREAKLERPKKTEWIEELDL